LSHVPALRKARELRATGRAVEAREEWLRVLAQLPDDASRWALADEALDALEGAPHSEALAASLQDRLAGPLTEERRSDLLFRLGAMRLAAGDTAGARAPLEEAFRAASGHRVQRARVLGELGWLEAAEGRPDVGASRLEDALAEAGLSHGALGAPLLARLGAVRLAQGRAGEALEALRAALAEAALGADGRETARRAREARAAESDPLRARVAGAEAAALREELERASWNQSLAARHLGISEQAVRYKMRKHGIRRPGASARSRG